MSAVPPRLLCHSHESDGRRMGEKRREEGGGIDGGDAVCLGRGGGIWPPYKPAPLQPCFTSLESACSLPEPLLASVCHSSSGKWSSGGSCQMDVVRAVQTLPCPFMPCETQRGAGRRAAGVKRRPRWPGKQQRALPMR